jgi:hypothetical protein
LDLVNQIAFDSFPDDSITDVNFFEEAQNKIQKDVLYSASRKKAKEQVQ